MQIQYITLSQFALDITGERYGRLVALGPISKTPEGKMVWQFRCDCGNLHSATLRNVRSGSTVSCGCYRKEQEPANKTHGLHGDRTLNILRHMIERCGNPQSPAYANYGGRGIKVCESWKNSPNEFHDYVSKLPGYGVENMTLDRIDNDGNYEPGNVRWATRTQQSLNRRNNRLLTYNGKTQNLTLWADEIGIDRTTLERRLSRGWSVKQAITTPIRQHKAYRKRAM